MNFNWKRIAFCTVLAVATFFITRMVGSTNWSKMGKTYSYACEHISFKVEPDESSLMVSVENKGKNSVALPFYYPSGQPDTPLEEYNRQRGFPLFVTVKDAQGIKTRFVVLGIKGRNSGGIELKYMQSGNFTIPHATLVNIDETGNLDFSLPFFKFLKNNKGKSFTGVLSMGRGDELDEDGDLQSTSFEIKG